MDTATPRGEGLVGASRTVVPCRCEQPATVFGAPVSKHMIMAQPQLHRSSILRRLRQSAIAAMVVCAPAVAAAQTSSDETEPRDRRPFAALSNIALSMRDSIVVIARSQIGTRYRYGGTTPTGGFDCSGFVRYVLNAIQLMLPRTAAQQAQYGATIPKDTTRLRPGDLLTFGRGDRVTHIGIYVGNGRYVHASPTAGRVIETSLERTESPLVKIWRGGRRLLAERDWLSDTTVATP
jgi:cell wall-associated NlpC family hydrolase